MTNQGVEMIQINWLHDQLFGYNYNYNQRVDQHQMTTSVSTLKTMIMIFAVYHVHNFHPDQPMNITITSATCKENL